MNREANSCGALQIAVCDDEIRAAENLAEKIANYMNFKKRECRVSKFISGEALLQAVLAGEGVFDAIYLDIRMSRLNGIETARLIRKTDEKTKLVFVTVLKEYVFDAFEVSPVNYLLKPIEDEKLFSTLDKITAAENGEKVQSLVIGTRERVERVLLENVVYCEVLNHRLFVYEKDRMHEYTGKIDELEKSLSEDFFRCHRSYIVNLRFVQRFRQGFAHMESLEKIPVATRRRSDFMKALLNLQRKEVC